MTALAAGGDRAGAIRHARVHEAMLRRELGTAPEAAVTRLAERLRAEAAPPESSEAAPALAGHTVGREAGRGALRGGVRSGPPGPLEAGPRPLPPRPPPPQAVDCLLRRPALGGRLDRGSPWAVAGWRWPTRDSRKCLKRQRPALVVAGRCRLRSRRSWVRIPPGAYA